MPALRYVPPILIVCLSGLSGAAANTITLDYQADESACPGASDFINWVAMASPHVSLTQGAGGEADVQVKLTPESNGRFVGTARRSSALQTQGRQMRGESCAAVAEALALTLALSLESDATPGVLSSPRIDPSAGSPRVARYWALGAGVGFSWLLPPAPLTGVVVQLQNGNSWKRQPAWGFPDLRLQLEYWRNDVLDSAPRAEFGMLAMAATACPIGTSPHQRLWLTLCGQIRGGRLEAEGLRIAQPRREVTWWGGIGPELLLTWQPSRRWQIGSHIGGSVPFNRVRFRVENPDDTISVMPSWAWNAGIDLLARFP